MKRSQDEEDGAEKDNPPKRVAIVKTLHIPADVVLEVVAKFMDERGLTMDGYEFVKWDVRMEPILAGNMMEPIGEDPIFQGVVLQKTVVKELPQ